MGKEGSRPVEEETTESTLLVPHRAGLRERYRVVVGKSRVTPRCCSRRSFVKGRPAARREEETR